MTLYLTTLLKKMSLHEKSDNKVLGSEKKKKRGLLKLHGTSMSDLF